MNFYVTATPIGNLEDMTYRAIRILGEVDIILCEDTRVTKKVLDHYHIKTPMMSYHAQSSDKKEEDIIDLVRRGATCALVSDAGTPCISDPGVRLIQRLYNEFPDIRILTIPGASALTSALSISGLSVAQFQFFGFVPHKKGRRIFFTRIAESVLPTVCYESPHRIMKTLEALSEILLPNRKVVIARELTKIHESVIRGDIMSVLEHFVKNPDQVRGEFVLLVEGDAGAPLE